MHYCNLRRKIKIHKAHLHQDKDGEPPFVGKIFDWRRLSIFYEREEKQRRTRVSAAFCTEVDGLMLRLDSCILFCCGACPLAPPQQLSRPWQIERTQQIHNNKW